MVYTRILKRGSKGTDVRYIKEALFKLQYYGGAVTQIGNDRFGADTVDAVKQFQAAHCLAVDGIIGKLTWAAIEAARRGTPTAEKDYVTAAKYPNIGAVARRAINTALNGVSVDRRDMVLEALKYCHDPALKAEHPISFYIRGGNLYNKDGSLNVVKMGYLTGAYYKQYKSYCTNGRLEMMARALSANPQTTGADCSGGIVGLLRHFGHVSKSFDATANSLCGNGYSTAVSAADARAGDWVGKPGHIGLYAGGGYSIEWAGGEYGNQLSTKTTRRLWSFTKKKLVNLSRWTKWRRPKLYD